MPIARLIGGRLRPTTITVAAAIVGLSAAVATAFGVYRLALGLWLLNRVIDGVDGSVARLTGRQSDLGGYLDLLLDVVVYSAIPIALVIERSEDRLSLVVLLLLALFYINITSWLYLSALIEKRAVTLRDRTILTSISMPSGMVEGGETVAIYALVLLMPQHALLLLSLMSGALAVGIIQRVCWALRNLDR